MQTPKPLLRNSKTTKPRTQYPGLLAHLCNHATYATKTISGRGEFFAGFRVLRGSGFKAAKWILRRRALKLGIRSLRRGAMVALRQCRRCEHGDSERRPDQFLVQRSHQWSPFRSHPWPAT